MKRTGLIGVCGFGATRVTSTIKFSHEEQKPTVIENTTMDTQPTMINDFLDRQPMEIKIVHRHVKIPETRTERRARERKNEKK